MIDISSLENIHSGEDIYVVGGGKSLDFYPRGLFGSRIVIAVNQAAKYVPCNYIVRKENSVCGDVPVIASKHLAGGNNLTLNQADYIFEHNQNELDKIDIGDAHPCGNKIIVSWSTITSAIHLAAFMGARAVFLVGHDCALVDGEQTAFNYYEGVGRLTAAQDYTQWLAEIAPQTLYMRDYLRNEYKIPLISLSPFIGLKHEGHEIT
jgi:hypothetical protein